MPPVACAAPEAQSAARLSAAARRRRHVAPSAVASPAPSAASACPRGEAWEVHKFGGTCVGSAERIAAAARLIIELPAAQKMVVVSAMGAVEKGVPKARSRPAGQPPL